jgi:hypothetical protein
VIRRIDLLERQAPLSQLGHEPLRPLGMLVEDADHDDLTFFRPGYGVTLSTTCEAGVNAAKALDRHVAVCYVSAGARRLFFSKSSG